MAAHGALHRDGDGEGTMATQRTLHDAFIDELRDAYDAERQSRQRCHASLARQGPSSYGGHSSRHLEATRGHLDRLVRAFELLGERARGRHCAGMAGIGDEGRSILDENLDEGAREACLIAAGQRTEHYEMAAYGTLVAWATAMDHRDVANLLQENLDEERSADELLSSIAEDTVHPIAANLAGAEGKQPSTLETLITSAKKIVKRAIKR
jgi:ferritin-like metal-binding protein YciE